MVQYVLAFWEKLTELMSFKIIKKLSEVNYAVQPSNHSHPHCAYHVNMMKLYYDRKDLSLSACRHLEEEGEDPLIDPVAETRARSFLDSIALTIT